MAARLGSAAAGDAAARWIGIESGGNPRASSSLNERGLAQVSKQSLKELGLTEADFAAMDNARTTDDQHADMAAIVMANELIRVAGSPPNPQQWGPPIGPQVDIGKGRKLVLGESVAAMGIGAAKLRHGLPLLVKEMREQNILRPTIKQTVDVARSSFNPSARLASFGKGVHATMGVSSHDLMLRFMIPVAVISLGDSAVGMFAKE